MCLGYDRHCGRPSWGWISREQCSTLTENIVFKCCTHPPWRPWDLMEKHCICIFSISKVKSVMQRHLNTAKLSFSQPVSDDILRNIRTAWLLGFPWVNRQRGKITWTIVGTSIWASLHSSYAVATRLLCCCYICCCYAIACCKTESSLSPLKGTVVRSVTGSASIDELWTKFGWNIFCNRNIKTFAKRI